MKCPKCQSEDTHVLSTGEILCLNEKCFAVSVPEAKEKSVPERVQNQGASTPIGRLNPDARKGLEEE